jgi:putative transposase
MPNYDPFNHHRRSVRLSDHDYSAAGAYFVTLCTTGRECLFGVIADMEMQLNEIGNLVTAAGRDIPQHFANVSLGAFVVMPNHIHGIVVIDDADVGAKHSSENRRMLRPYKCPPRGTLPASLGAIVQNFKSVSTRKTNQLRVTPGAALWQRNYYEHIIRTEREWDVIACYIFDNPANWAEDSDNPAAGRGGT